MLPHLKDCIRSLQNQSYEDIEIVCIVDGNQDYFQVIESEVDNIKLYLNERNLGLLLTRNRGVEIASGDVVAFIDDDAVADERWIEELVRMYEEFGAIAAGGKLKPLWIDKEPNWFPEEFYWMIGATHLGFPERVSEVRNTFGSNISFRRDVFMELGGFNPEMGGIKGTRILQGGETELCDRMRKRFGKSVMYNPEAIVYHKVFPRRLKIGFLSRRAFWQGYSKAVMERVSGEIEEERGFLKYLIGERIPARLKGILKGSGVDALKVTAMFYFTILVGIGYAYGKIKT
jgi:glycosyltransferase involved in cell wall biosynthesis